MDVWEFIKEYYVDSIVYKEGYNPVNTLTWAFILVLAAVSIYKMLRKHVRFDEKFVAGNLPFIVLGSSMRVMEDAGFLSPPYSYIFMTPLIYLLIFAIAIPSLFISLKLERERYWIHHAAIGTTLSVFIITLLLLNLKIVCWWVLPTSFSFAYLFSLAYGFITARYVEQLNNPLSKAVFFSHMVDGWATFLGIQYLGYWELHVLPRYLISAFGAWIMIPAKIIIFVIILYLLDTMEDGNFRNFIKFVLIVLGLAPGLRDSMRMTLQV
jgi:uncharacterized membrane protein